MQQKIFETREKASQLLDEALKIWRQSPQSENLEGLDKDPVMTMLLTALAWQSNETDSEIERLKTDVAREFVQSLSPYELGHAIPATAVVETSIKGGLEGPFEYVVDSKNTFKLSGSQYTFMPVMRTKVIGAEVRSVMRIDGRRWKVSFAFDGPVSDLSGFSFAVKNLFFKDLKVSYKGNHIPLIKPWDYSDLPLSDCFSLNASLYSGTQTFNASMIGLDLVACNNLRLFCVRNHDASQYLQDPVTEMNLIFEFSGIGDAFSFDKKELAINCVVLAETKLNMVTLSGDKPFARVSGSNSDCSRFMNMVSPSGDDIPFDGLVEVRRVAADRFNQASLYRLLSTLVYKYNTDFYAFQNHKELSDDNAMHNLQDILEKMLKACQNNPQGSMEGVYLLLHPNNLKQKTSHTVKYLTTHGADLGSALNESSTFDAPAPLNSRPCAQIVPPVAGRNEISENLCEGSLIRYQIITNDRIVTPADIKAFCYNELRLRYGIEMSLVESIRVTTRPFVATPEKEVSHGDYGYEIFVKIIVEDNGYVRRAIGDKLPQVEIVLQKMMEVRSSNIFPIVVEMTIC